MDHLGALLLTALATWLAVRLVRRDPQGPAARHLRLALMVALPALNLVEDVVGYVEGWLTLQIGLPLQLCDLSLILAVMALATLEPAVSEPLYFFALSGTLPAVITPELGQGFPAFRFLVYFLPHGLVVLTTLVLVLGFRLVPRPRAWWRAFLQLNLYAAFIAVVNAALGTNFLYLQAKPRTPTPFDWFGPWPYYLLTLEAVTLAVFFALDRPLLRLRVGRGVDSYATTARPAPWLPGRSPWP